MTPFFSVIIPVYNRSSVLNRALLSVLAQSCQDFEIVIVDDGSTDDPAQVVAQLADPRMQFIWQPNKGGGAARNAGIDACRGRYIAPLDSDDEFLPNHLERMKQLLDGAENTVGYARVLVDRGNGRSLLKPPRGLRTGEHMATHLLCDRGFVPTITICVEAALAKRVRYAEGLRFGEDTDFAIRLFLEGCQFVMLEEPGAVWHDVHDPGRASANRKGVRLAGWIEDLRPRIPAAAYYGCRGWSIAKGIAPQGRFRALWLYLEAVMRGCYAPKLAAIIFLQIFLPDSLYRRIADQAIGVLAWQHRRAKGSNAALVPAA